MHHESRATAGAREDSSFDVDAQEFRSGAASSASSSGMKALMHPVFDAPMRMPRSIPDCQ